MNKQWLIITVIMAVVLGVSNANAVVITSQEITFSMDMGSSGTTNEQIAWEVRKNGTFQQVAQADYAELWIEINGTIDNIRLTESRVWQMVYYGVVGAGAGILTSGGFDFWSAVTSGSQSRWVITPPVGESSYAGTVTLAGRITSPIMDSRLHYLEGSGVFDVTGVTNGSLRRSVFNGTQGTGWLDVDISQPWILKIGLDTTCNSCPDPTAIGEPKTLALLALGLLGIGFTRRKKTK